MRGNRRNVGMAGGGAMDGAVLGAAILTVLVHYERLNVTIFSTNARQRVRITRI